MTNVTNVTAPSGGPIETITNPASGAPGRQLPEASGLRLCSTWRT